MSFRFIIIAFVSIIGTFALLQQVRSFFYHDHLNRYSIWLDGQDRLQRFDGLLSTNGVVEIYLSYAREEKYNDPTVTGLSIFSRDRPLPVMPEIKYLHIVNSKEPVAQLDPSFVGFGFHLRNYAKEKWDFKRTGFKLKFSVPWAVLALPAAIILWRKIRHQGHQRGFSIEPNSENQQIV